MQAGCWAARPATHAPDELTCAHFEWCARRMPRWLGVICVRRHRAPADMLPRIGRLRDGRRALRAVRVGTVRRRGAHGSPAGARADWRRDGAARESARDETVDLRLGNGVRAVESAIKRLACSAAPRPAAERERTGTQPGTARGAPGQRNERGEPTVNGGGNMTRSCRSAPAGAPHRRGTTTARSDRARGDTVLEACKRWHRDPTLATSRLGTRERCGCGGQVENSRRASAVCSRAPRRDGVRPTAIACDSRKMCSIPACRWTSPHAGRGAVAGGVRRAAAR